jgi:ribosomal-protein-alanine N-acetyltransferase
MQESPDTAAWSVDSYEKLNTNGGIIAFVSDTNDRINGFLFGSQVADEAEVLSIAVAADSRCKGQGTALLQACIDEFNRRGVTSLFLEVRESNRAAIHFYKKFGFVKTRLRKGYYQDPTEDAICMQKKLTP